MFKTFLMIAVSLVTFSAMAQVEDIMPPGGAVAQTEDVAASYSEDAAVLLSLSSGTQLVFSKNFIIPANLNVSEVASLSEREMCNIVVSSSTHSRVIAAGSVIQVTQTSDRNSFYRYQNVYGTAIEIGFQGSRSAFARIECNPEVARIQDFKDLMALVGVKVILAEPEVLKP